MRSMCIWRLMRLVGQWLGVIIGAPYVLSMEFVHTHAPKKATDLTHSLEYNNGTNRSTAWYFFMAGRARKLKTIFQALKPGLVMEAALLWERGIFVEKTLRTIDQWPVESPTAIDARYHDVVRVEFRF